MLYVSFCTSLHLMKETPFTELCHSLHEVQVQMLATYSQHEVRMVLCMVCRHVECRNSYVGGTKLLESLRHLCTLPFNFIAILSNQVYHVLHTWIV